MCMLTFNWHSHLPTQPRKHSFLIIHKKYLPLQLLGRVASSQSNTPKVFGSMQVMKCIKIILNIEDRSGQRETPNSAPLIHLWDGQETKNAILRYLFIIQFPQSSITTREIRLFCFKKNKTIFTNSVIISHICCRSSAFYLGTQRYGCWNKSLITPEFVNLPQPNSGKCYSHLWSFLKSRLYHTPKSNNMSVWSVYSMR